VLTAIEIVDANRVALVQDPRLQLLYSGWLLEVGRLEEAAELLASLERLRGMNQQTIWRDLSVYAAWARGDYQRVSELCTGTINSTERRRLEALLLSGPFSASLPVVTTGDKYPWTHALAAEDAGDRRLVEVGAGLLRLALCQIELGDLAAAKATLQQAFEEVPATPLRPLLVFYWHCLTNETLDAKPPQEESAPQQDIIPDEPAL
jgi:ATP/maltotriose-dependent transcriptional regulator MalT